MAVTLSAKSRENLKKSATKHIRKEGLVPGVVYGREEASQPISINELELVKTVRDEGKNAIISLNVEGSKSFDVMLHDYQMDPIKNELTHVDFFVVNMSEELEATVPVQVVGEAKGAKEGGVLQQPVFELVVSAKPKDIPETIEIDVSALEIGDVLTVADLPKDANYRVVDDSDSTLATVTAPTVVEDTDTADAEGSAEPERVGEKKEEAAE
ncbi:50S ribosomal protein L25/general stress protein Ctc [Aciduricibacillus chroicocephali]|uniref:Large ribosomal subunit protein bL25 n=1 Tax=Aciduricibacillus chroicocephali TaxID=3054939 RepID=A0ABY9KYJ3_9BACI|nr:50S ribosomal protein L25/general stress protein Ctc [Bacillaceae bacterium 44XB]